MNICIMIWTFCEIIANLILRYVSTHWLCTHLSWHLLNLSISTIIKDLKEKSAMEINWLWTGTDRLLLIMNRTCLQLNAIERNWLQLNAIECNWMQLNAIDCNWSQLITLEHTWLWLSMIDSNYLCLIDVTILISRFLRWYICYLDELFVPQT